VDISRLDRFGTAHHGVVTLGAALERGISEDAWWRAGRRGEIEILHPGVARVMGSPRTREQRIMAAVAAAGPGAMASHRSGAHVWGVRRPAHDPVDVIVPVRTVRTRLPGVVVHHPTDLDGLRSVMRNGIPTTDPLRTLLDLGAVDPKGVAAAVDHIVSARLVSPSALMGFLRRHQRPGRAGVRPLRAALERWHVDGADADSVLESRMADVAKRYGLPSLTFHAVVAGYEVDFLFDDTTVVIECDGHERHGLDRDQFEFDRLRSAELTAAGYVMVHVTWRQLTREPRRTVDRIEGVLRRWAPHVLR
jgi:very-short-patch-repair endonuclease